MARRARTVVALAVIGGVVLPLAMFVLGVALPAAQADPAPDAEARSTALVESERSNAGLSGYRIANDLVAVARQQAERMARENRLHHNPNLGSDVQGWSAVGENVGVGMSIEDIHRAFMESATHRSEILSGSFTEVGIGVVPGSDGAFWVAQVFRKPMPAAAASQQGEPAARPAPTRATRAATQPAAGVAPAVPVPPSPVAPAAPRLSIDPTFDLDALTMSVKLDIYSAATPLVRVLDTPVLARSGSDARSARVTPGPSASGALSASPSTREVEWPVAVAASMLLFVVLGLASTVVRESVAVRSSTQRPSEAARRQRNHASINWSRSPSRTAWTLPVS